MPHKRDRQNSILEVIRRSRIESQETLAAELATLGIRVSQATLSRDIQELGLVKVGNAYVVARRGIRRVTEPILRRALREHVLTIDHVDPMLVLKTGAGSAATVGDAIDGSGWPEIVGTIAGDDTIFVLCRSAAALQSVIGKIEELRV